MQGMAFFCLIEKENKIFKETNVRDLRLTLRPSVMNFSMMILMVGFNL